MGDIAALERREQRPARPAQHSRSLRTAAGFLHPSSQLLGLAVQEVQ